MSLELVLRRVPATTSTALENIDKRSDLAKRAAEKLQHNARLISFQQTHNRTMLLATLALIDIRPLTDESVATYKARMLNWYNNLRPLIGILMTTVAGTCTAVGVCTSLIAQLDANTTLILIHQLAFLAVSTPFLALGIWMLETTKWNHTFSWNEIPLSHYGFLIPDSVISDALKIREALPNAALTVDYLTSNRNRVEPDYDPFLKVTHNGVSFYTNVWDETEYEKQVL